MTTRARRIRKATEMTLSPEALYELDMYASKNGMSRSAVIERLIRRRLADLPPPPLGPKDDEA